MFKEEKANPTHWKKQQQPSEDYNILMVVDI